MRKINISPIEFSTVMLVIILLIFIIVMFQDSASGGELDREMRIFVSDLQIRYRSGIIVEDVINLNTGRKWELSGKIKNSLVDAIKRRFIVIDPSIDLKKEREKSLSGYSVIKADYVLIGKYEVKKNIVRISLKLLRVDTSEVVVSRHIDIYRSSIEMYLTDYSEEELDMIIDKNNESIKDLLDKHEEKSKRLLKLQRIKQQRKSISRIRDGDYDPFSNQNYKLLWFAGAGVFYGSTSFTAARRAEADGKKGADFVRLLGILSYAGASWCVYTYFNDQDISVQTSMSKIYVSITRKF